MDLASSKTKINLMRSFAGESMARNRYTMSSAKAKSEGHYAIAALFDYTACQEKEHAEIFYNHLKELTDTNFDIDAAYPINIYESTLKYLEAAVKNEYEEYESIYKSFGDIAKEEGFNGIANSFYLISNIERGHGDRFKLFADSLKNSSLYSSDSDTIWFCTNCGHIHTGTSAPMLCPVCSHPQGYFVNDAFRSALPVLL